MTELKIINPHNAVSYLASYRQGHLISLKVLSAPNANSWQSIWASVHTLTPNTLGDLPVMRQKFPDITYTELAPKAPPKSKAKPASSYKLYVAAWFDFYNRLNGIDPKFGAADGASIKAIIRYLESQAQTPTEALNTWQALLSNWHRLDDFYRKSPDLKFINSQLNKIITNIKDATRKTTNHSHADDLRQRFK